jgi:hypothetical protein
LPPLHSAPSPPAIACAATSASLDDCQASRARSESSQARRCWLRSTPGAAVEAGVLARHGVRSAAACKLWHGAHCNQDALGTVDCDMEACFRRGTACRPNWHRPCTETALLCLQTPAAHSPRPSACSRRRPALPCPTRSPAPSAPRHRAPLGLQVGQGATMRACTHRAAAPCAPRSPPLAAARPRLRSHALTAGSVRLQGSPCRPAFGANAAQRQPASREPAQPPLSEPAWVAAMAGEQWHLRPPNPQNPVVFFGEGAGGQGYGCVLRGLSGL